MRTIHHRISRRRAREVHYPPLPDIQLKISSLKYNLIFEVERCNFRFLVDLGDGHEIPVFEGSPRFSDEEMERSSNFLEGKLLDSCSLQTFLKDYQRRMLDGLSKKSYNGLKKY